MAAIQSLPVELLVLIFEQLFVISESWKSLQSYSDMDLGDPTLFPFAIARVCQDWREVVAQRPEYWKHVVFDLASKEPPFLGAFGWAKETKFTALVFDSRYGPYWPDAAQRRLTTTSKIPTPISADHEQAMVSAITEALLPHLKRCSSLQYSTSFSDLLPEITTILQHPCDCIRELRLDYHINNSDISTRALKYHCDGYTKFSTVEHLSIDVVAFILMMEQCPQLPNCLFSSYLTRPLAFLEISNYQFQVDDDHTSNATSAAWSVSNFIRHLSGISHQALNICLRGLSMTASGRHHTETGTTLEKWFVSINDLHAVDLSEDFLHHLFQQVKFVDTCFHGRFYGRCIFPMNTQPLPFSCLYLHELPLNANLPRLLTGWTGRTMDVTSCPCFNDALLGMLAEEGTCMEDCLAPDLSVLSIEHCDNVSRRALMSFFVKRNNTAVSSNHLEEVEYVTLDGVQVEPTAEELALYK